MVDSFYSLPRDRFMAHNHHTDSLRHQNDPWPKIIHVDSWATTHIYSDNNILHKC